MSDDLDFSTESLQEATAGLNRWLDSPTTPSLDEQMAAQEEHNARITSLARSAAHVEEQRRLGRYLIVGAVAVLGAYLLGNHFGYNGGVDDGMTWQWTYAGQMTACMEKQEQSFVDYQRTKGVAEVVARERFAGGAEWEGSRRVCQKHVTQGEIGSPPRAWPWEEKTGVDLSE